MTLRAQTREIKGTSKSRLDEREAVAAWFMTNIGRHTNSRLPRGLIVAD